MITPASSAVIRLLISSEFAAVSIIDLSIFSISTMSFYKTVLREILNDSKSKYLRTKDPLMYVMAQTWIMFPYKITLPSHATITSITCMIICHHKLCDIPLV